MPSMGHFLKTARRNWRKGTGKQGRGLGARGLASPATDPRQCKPSVAPNPPRLH